MMADASADDGQVVPRPFDPAPLAAQVRAALDSYLRDRAPDRRLAFWKAVAFGYGWNFESLAGCAMPFAAVTSP
jgi:hypothetical protein